MNSTSELLASQWGATHSSRIGVQAPPNSTARHALANHAARAAAKRSRRRLLGTTLLVSAALHALLLFGFNHTSGTAAPGEDATIPAPEVPLAFELTPEEVEPLQTVQTEADHQTGALAEGLAAASLPEPISSVAVSDITVVIRPSIPVQPLAQNGSWSVPSGQLRTQPIAADKVFKVAELDRQPVLVAKTDPVFPPELTASNTEGVVVVRFIVTARGSIESVSVLSAPHPAFGAAVTKALSRWQFRAGMKNGRAVNTEMELPVRFNPAST